MAVQLTNNLVIDNDPSCSSSSMAYFAESFSSSGSAGAQCYFLGYTTPGTTHKYSVMKDDYGSTFKAYLDGVLPAGRTITATFPNTQAHAVLAGGEIVVCDSCSFSGVRWSGTFGGSGNTPWQRYNTTLGWYTIQSATDVFNGDGAWSFGTANFPTVWTVSH